MKALTLILLAVSPCISYSQGVFTNNTHSALQQVINDYPNHFRNIKGDLLKEDAQSTDFSSTVIIPGALNTVITRYSSAEDEEIYSWRCTMMESEDFEEATKKYQDLFKQITNSIIKFNGQRPFILNGSYEPPTDEKRFMASSFKLVPSAPAELAKVKVELTLEFQVTAWKISLLVYDQAEEEELVMD